MVTIADIPVAESTTNQSKIEFILDEKRIDRTIMSDEYSFLLKDYLQKNPFCFSVNYNKDFLSQEILPESTSMHNLLSESNFIIVNNENYLLSPKSLININLLMAS